MSDRRDNTRVAVAFVGSILAGGAGAFACGGGDEDARAGSSEDASAENAAATDDASPEGAPATDPADGGTWLADGALPGAKEACEAYLQAGCDRQAECDVRRPCETFAEYCPAVLFGEGSSRTVAGTLACAQARGKDALCGNAYGRRPCADGFFCTDSRSGTCQPLHKLGEDCQTTTQCEETLYCERSSGLGSCVARVGLGASCGTTTVDGGASYSVLCESGATCGRILDDAGAYAYRCVRVGSLGSACGGSPYEKCAGALSCVGNVCALTDRPRDAGPG